MVGGGLERRVGTEEHEPQNDWGFYELQNRVDDIYFAHDRACDYGPSTMLGKLVGNATNLSQYVRRDAEFQHTDRALTNVVIWTTTFANAAGVEIQNVLSEKYGSGCPHCYQMPCLLTRGEECKIPEGQTSRPAAQNVPQTIEEWQDHLGIMYRNNHPNDEFTISAAQKVCGRLLDEVGELVAASYSDVQAEQRLVSFDDGMKPWESEIADVLAWSFALANGFKLKTGKYSLGVSLKEKYKNGCSYCGAAQCQCPKVSTFIEEIKL